MERLVRRALLLGVGAAALTVETVDALLGEVGTVMDEIRDEEFLSKVIEKGKEARADLERKFMREMRTFVRQADLATKEDILRIERRIEELATELHKDAK